MKFLLPIIIVAITSCAKNSSDDLWENGLPKMVATSPGKLSAKDTSADFDGKTNDEILKLKYEKMTLRCELRTQYSKELNLCMNPNDAFEIDFLNDPALSKSNLKLVALVSGRIVSVQLQFLKYEISDVSFTNAEGDSMSAQFSPILSLDLNYQAGTLRGKGNWSNIYENMPTDLIKESVQILGEESSYFDNLSCTLITTPKDRYKVQFQKNLKN